MHAALFVLKVPQISDPYSTIGFNKWSNKCRLVFILGLPVVVNLVSLNEAFMDFLKMSFVHKYLSSARQLRIKILIFNPHNMMKTAGGV